MPLGSSASTNGALHASCSGLSLHVSPNLRLGRPSLSWARIRGGGEGGRGGQGLDLEDCDIVTRENDL